jgi:hypothetical protein
VYIDIRKGKGVFKWFTWRRPVSFQIPGNKNKIRNRAKAKAKASFVFRHNSVFAFDFSDREKEF